MFEGVIKRAERSIDALVAKYVSRAIVAVPLIVAGGFGTAALTVKLVEVYGQVTAYGIAAAGFAVLAIAAAAIGLGSTPTVEPAVAPVAEKPSEAVEEGVPMESLLTPELMGVLSTAAPLALPPVMRATMRNLPLLLVMAVIAYVFSRKGTEGEAPGQEAASAPDTGDTAEASAFAARAA
jgi:hypothetical protein